MPSGFVVRVLIALAVPEVLHQFRRRIAKVKWDGLGHVSMCVGRSTRIGSVHSITLWRRGKVDGSLRQCSVAFGHADEVHGVLRGNCDRQRLRVGIADILRRKTHEPTGDVERILTGFDHSREPIHRGIRVAVAHRLVQRRDQVVMLFATLVIQERAALDGFRDTRGVDATPPIDHRCGGHAELQQIRSHTGIAVGVQSHCL